jgi:diacylglycerol O-acyltransferase
MTFLGAPITDVMPIAVIAGNVTVSFAVLSYAGILGITVIADPDACPDLEALTAALADELETVTAIGEDRDLRPAVAGPGSTAGDRS